MYLLDSNIVIYFLNQNQKLTEYLVSLRSDDFAISTISRIEVLMGAEKHTESIDYTKEQLDDYRQIGIDVRLADFAVETYFRINKRLKFKDLLIAATAKLNNLTLVTADKDFQKIPGLKVKLFTP